MCLRYCVLGFAAHSIISGVDISDDDCCMDDECNDFMGYGTSSTISCETPIYIILYVLRDIRTLFMYYFERSDTLFYIDLIIFF